MSTIASAVALTLQYWLLWSWCTDLSQIDSYIYYSTVRTMSQRWSQDFERGSSGSGNRSPPVGYRGKAPVGGLGDKVPRNLQIVLQWFTLKESKTIFHQLRITDGGFAWWWQVQWWGSSKPLVPLHCTRCNSPPTKGQCTKPHIAL